MIVHAANINQYQVYNPQVKQNIEKKTDSGESIEVSTGVMEFKDKQVIKTASGEVIEISTASADKKKNDCLPQDIMLEEAPETQNELEIQKLREEIRKMQEELNRQSGNCPVNTGSINLKSCNQSVIPGRNNEADKIEPMVAKASDIAKTVMTVLKQSGTVTSNGKLKGRHGAAQKALVAGVNILANCSASESSKEERPVGRKHHKTHAAGSHETKKAESGGIFNVLKSIFKNNGRENKPPCNSKTSSSVSSMENLSIDNQGAAASPGSRISETGRAVKILSYNIHNMFESAEQGKSLESMEASASVVNGINPDIMILEEVENKRILDEFIDRYMKNSGFPYRILLPGNDPRGINVAVASRFPVKSVESHKDDKFPMENRKTKTAFSRDLLRVDLEISPDTELTVYATHLKSKIGGEQAEIKRLAEARQIHSILEKEMKAYPGRKFVVAGDFNDTATSQPVKIIMNYDNTSLYDPLTGYSVDKSYTYQGKNSRERLDYILLSPGLKEVCLGASVSREPEETARIASDHYPVSVTVQI